MIFEPVSAEAVTDRTGGIYQISDASIIDWSDHRFQNSPPIFGSGN